MQRTLVVAALVFVTLVGLDLLVTGLASSACVPGRGCRGSRVPYLLGGGLLLAAAASGWVWLRRVGRR